MYDAIVVGARCAGSATALLLARHGHDGMHSLVARAVNAPEYNTKEPFQGPYFSLRSLRPLSDLCG